GQVDGQPFRRSVPMKEIADSADYLPRTWAKLEIDRLLAENTQANKDKIVALSKAMYVMTPFTSLLVLENDEMYKQYNVDRGRKDHWALYPCPEKIPVVHEPGQGQVANDRKKTAEQVCQTIVVRTMAQQSPYTYCVFDSRRRAIEETVKPEIWWSLMTPDG